MQGEGGGGRRGRGRGGGVLRKELCLLWAPVGEM